MARRIKCRPKGKHKKSKPTKRTATEYILNALIDLLVGILLILIGKMMD